MLNICTPLVNLYYQGKAFALAMSVVQVKNLNRRLENLAREATHELDKACGNEL